MKVLKIVALTIVVLFLSILVIEAKPLEPNANCSIGTVARHDAFYSQVLQVFPDRAVPYVHGYIATKSCSDMGRSGTLHFQGFSFSVAVVDCLNRSHVVDNEKVYGASYLGDVDRKLWLEARAPNRPVDAMICWD